MPVTWILIANDSEARLYQQDAVGKEFRPVQQFEHPAGRKKDRDIDADKPGRSYDSQGTQRHAMGREVSPHQHELKSFVHELAGFLATREAKHHFERLALLAPPHFLGELRAALNERVKKCIYKEVHKEYPAYINDHDLFPRLHVDLDL